MSNTKIKDRMRSAMAGLGSAIKTGSLLELRFDELHENPLNPRTVFDEEALEELAQSIRSKGIIEPIVVRERVEGGYLILTGHRRRRAGQLAGLEYIPAIVRAAADIDDSIIIALIENDQKENLTPMERARAYRSYIESMGNQRGAQKELAEMLGKSPAFISRHLSLLTLPIELQRLCEDGIVVDPIRLVALASTDAETQAAEIRRHRGLEPPVLVIEAQPDTLGDAAETRSEQQRAEPTGSAPPANVTTSETRIEKTAKTKPLTPKVPDDSPPAAQIDGMKILSSIERRLTEHLSVKVSVKAGVTGPTGKGALTLHYRSMDELNRVLEQIGLLND